MKTEDFERLKELVEKEGFTLHANSSPDIGEMVTVILRKKDPWEGVEFVMDAWGFIFKIYKKEGERFYDCNGKWESISRCSPSTESAYIDQLKKEAFERFGQIKNGDKFKRGWLDERDTWPEIAEIDNTLRGFDYNKQHDQLNFRGTCIYEKGKWAKKVNRKIKVKHFDSKTYEINSFYGVENYSPIEIGLSCFFHIHGIKEFDLYDVSKFLTEQLENYLNQNR
jgi:hypothetical protein